MTNTNKQADKLEAEIQEILPCPFCGSTNIRLQSEINEGNWTRYHYARCETCLCRIDSTDNKILAVRDWNGRVSPQAEIIKSLQSENQSLKAEIESKELARREMMTKWGHAIGDKDKLKAENQRLREALSDARIWLTIVRDRCQILEADESWKNVAEFMKDHAESGIKCIDNNPKSEVPNE